MTINPPDSELPPRVIPDQPDPIATFEDFRRAWPVSLFRLSTQLQGQQWAAAFDFAYVTDPQTNSRFWAVSGHGATEAEAILDYQRRISGRTIAVGSGSWPPIEHDGSKLVVPVPYWPQLFEGQAG